MAFAIGDRVVWLSYYGVADGAGHPSYAATVVKTCRNGHILIRLDTQPYPNSHWYRQVKPDNLIKETQHEEE